MRIVCFGSGEFGVPTFNSIHARHDIVAVVTQPDRPAGRKRAMTPTPVAQWAEGADLNLVKSPDVNTSDFTQQIAATKPDAAVVIAFGQKLSPQIIDCFPAVAINLHASLLPKYRGAAPINWAIINGETSTGLSVISLSQRMDAGLTYAQIDTAIDPLETAGELHDRLALLGPGIVLDVLAHAENNSLKGMTQDDSLATRAPKLSRHEATIDFDTEPLALRNRIHGLTPWPGVKVNWIRSSSPDASPETLSILRVTTKVNQPPNDMRQHDEPTPGTILEDGHVAVRNGSIKLLELQLPGRRPLPIDEFLRGNPLTPGDMLTPFTKP